MIYLSLTTIPERLKNVNKTIDSLIKQSLSPDKIFLNIPKKYNRFKININDNEIPNFSEKVQITRSDDYGPGTKLLGSLDKIPENSLLILVDDDHIYDNYMVETFNKFYEKYPNNAHSFYVHPLGKFGIAQGADGFAINTNSLKNIKSFYEKVVKDNYELFIHDDLWISFFLYFIKKNKIYSLHNYLHEDEKGKKKKIYIKHNDNPGLIASYGENFNEAIKERDKRAHKCFQYMLEKIKNSKLELL